VIRQTGGHRRAARMPAAIAATHAKRSDRPAEVVRVHREVRRRLMHVPVLRETVGLANLPPVAVAIRAVVPFDEGGVDPRADKRIGVRSSGDTIYNSTSSAVTQTSREGGIAVRLALPRSRATEQSGSACLSVLPGSPAGSSRVPEAGGKPGSVSGAPRAGEALGLAAARMNCPWPMVVFPCRRCAEGAAQPGYHPS
jgi:hypothetical protein